MKFANNDVPEFGKFSVEIMTDYVMPLSLKAKIIFLRHILSRKERTLLSLF